MISSCGKAIVFFFFELFNTSIIFDNYTMRDDNFTNKIKQQPTISNNNQLDGVEIETQQRHQRCKTQQQ